MLNKNNREVLYQAKESEEQISLFEWAGYTQRRHPELKLLYHVPNGGLRNKTTACRLKLEGVKAGVPDLCLPVARGRYHGLYIELKARRGKATSNQTEWLDALEEQGYATAVCYGWRAASETITNYLSLNLIGTPPPTRRI